jgi:hypothetical protein
MFYLSLVKFGEIGIFLWIFYHFFWPLSRPPVTLTYEVGNDRLWFLVALVMNYHNTKFECPRSISLREKSNVKIRTDGQTFFTQLFLNVFSVKTPRKLKIWRRKIFGSLHRLTMLRHVSQKTMIFFKNCLKTTYNIFSLTKLQTKSTPRLPTKGGLAC